MLKVYGFPRSGNNLLAKYIADTFYPDQDTALHNLRTGHWSNRTYVGTNPYGKCLGSHIEFPIDGLFVVRDTVDVAYSVWRSNGFRNINDNSDFSEFIRKPLDWRFSPPLRYHGDKGIIQHHADHLYESRVGTWIDYNTIVEFPEQVLELISSKYQVPMKQFNKIEEPIGYSPNWGVEKDISDEDREYIESTFEDYMNAEHGGFLSSVRQARDFLTMD